MIRNSGEVHRRVQVSTRSWRIVGSDGKVEAEIESEPGVVGRQPIIAAGEVFEYMSFTPLESERGFMEGSLGLHDPDAEGAFLCDADIARFDLRGPPPPA